LGKHYVGYHKLALGHEAQPAQGSALPVEQLDIHLGAIPNPIASASFPADDIEVPVLFVLIALSGRKVLFEKLNAANMRFSSVLVDCLIKQAHQDTTNAFH
jgi:hypothetical protein